MDRTLPNPESEPTITVRRYAAITGVGLRTAYDAVERGEVPAIRVGRRIVIPTARALRAAGLLQAA